jgi:hypothetical protein
MFFEKPAIWRKFSPTNYVWLPWGHVIPALVTGVKFTLRVALLVLPVVIIVAVVSANLLKSVPFFDFENLLKRRHHASAAPSGSFRRPADVYRALSTIEEVTARIVSDFFREFAGGFPISLGLDATAPKPATKPTFGQFRNLRSKFFTQRAARRPEDNST